MEPDLGSWQSPDISRSHLYRGTIAWTPPTAIYRAYTVVEHLFYTVSFATNDRTHGIFFHCFNSQMRLTIRDTRVGHFQCCVVEWKLCYFDLNFTLKFCFKGSICQWYSIGSGNGMALHRWQAKLPELMVTHFTDARTLFSLLGAPSLIEKVRYGLHWAHAP